MDRIYDFFFSSKMSRIWFRSAKNPEDFWEKYCSFLPIFSLKWFIIGGAFFSGLFYGIIFFVPSWFYAPIGILVGLILFFLKLKKQMI